jgi:hypothetical protein
MASPRRAAVRGAAAASQRRRRAPRADPAECRGHSRPERRPRGRRQPRDYEKSPSSSSPSSRRTSSASPSPASSPPSSTRSRVSASSSASGASNGSCLGGRFSVGLESGTSPFFPDLPGANTVTERDRRQYPGRDSHRLLRLELRALAWRPLSAVGLERPLARDLRAVLRHGRAQCDLLPPTDGEDGRGLGETNTEDFLFAVKASRYLTHVKRLRDIVEGVKRMDACLEPLRRASKLAPILWQLPPHFPRDDDVLQSALETLTSGRHAFEFRDPSWFAPEVYELLRGYGAALVVADRSPATPSPWVDTGGWSYLRFHSGRAREGNYSARELRAWAKPRCAAGTPGSSPLRSSASGTSSSASFPSTSLRQHACVAKRKPGRLKRPAALLADSRSEYGMEYRLVSARCISLHRVA